MSMLWPRCEAIISLMSKRKPAIQSLMTGNRVTRSLMICGGGGELDGCGDVVVGWGCGVVWYGVVVGWCGVGCNDGCGLGLC